MEPPAEVARLRLLAVAAPIDPEAGSGFVLPLEMIPHGVAFAVAPPPVAEDPLGAVGPSDPVANAAPAEGDRGLLRQEGEA